MKKIILSLAFAMATLASVHAAEVMGVVATVNTETMMITLDDGTEVQVSADVALDDVVEGAKVTIETDENNVATSVMITE